MELIHLLITRRGPGWRVRILSGGTIDAAQYNPRMGDLEGLAGILVRTDGLDSRDLAAALVTNCGDPKNFFRNHSLILRAQDKWIGIMGTASAGQNLTAEVAFSPVRSAIAPTKSVTSSSGRSI